MKILSFIEDEEINRPPRLSLTACQGLARQTGESDGGQAQTFLT